MSFGRNGRERDRSNARRSQRGRSGEDLGRTPTPLENGRQTRVWFELFRSRQECGRGGRYQTRAAGRLRVYVTCRHHVSCHEPRPSRQKHYFSDDLPTEPHVKLNLTAQVPDYKEAGELSGLATKRRRWRAASVSPWRLTTPPASNMRGWRGLSE